MDSSRRAWGRSQPRIGDDGALSLTAQQFAGKRVSPPVLDSVRRPGALGGQGVVHIDVEQAVLLPSSLHTRRATSRTSRFFVPTVEST